ncbi:hypothetical protein KO516_19475 [Citreicella sp. C3M06]|uniref:hypothetical protein n=1 Tax=Citreicella sp. C3M06 TaxID=2841564 RepID=UPI001C09B4B8|nr:hypothetical protein [Citreicella sp. C3M06]MBU2962970.1 hypothetical protein [Citreicella sp. C3M06]
MTRFSALLVASLIASPALAQDEGRLLMDEGARMFLDGLRNELDPAMRGLRERAESAGPAIEEFLGSIGPGFRDLMGEVEDWSVYEAPETLPNGDILIRRKPDAEEDAPQQAQPALPDIPDMPAMPQDRPLEPRERKGLPPLDGNRIDL